ncbi:MAG: adenosylmethionine decarboxylase [Candidatus Sumerlaeia bacterium]
MVTLDFYGCAPDALSDPSQVRRVMLEAAGAMGATVIGDAFNHFAPFGVSGVIIIAESHLAIHTWPEYGFAAVTFETCGASIDPWKGLPILREAFEAERVSQFEIKRGLFEVAPGTLPHKAQAMIGTASR